jgi:uncharacterized protein (DUF1778 family)
MTVENTSIGADDGAEAEASPLDRTVFTVAPEVYAGVLARLDAPPAPNPRLLRTLRSPPSWSDGAP